MRAYPINLVGHGTVGSMTSRPKAIEACETLAQSLDPSGFKWSELEKHNGRIATNAGFAIEFKMHIQNGALEIDPQVHV